MRNLVVTGAVVLLIAAVAAQPCNNSKCLKVSSSSTIIGNWTLIFADVTIGLTCAAVGSPCENPPDPVDLCGDYIQFEHSCDPVYIKYGKIDWDTDSSGDCDVDVVWWHWDCESGDYEKGGTETHVGWTSCVSSGC